MEKRNVKKTNGMSSTELVLAGILLAAGFVLRMVVPPIAGITPNFLILMYCLIIYLIKPKFGETIGISLVAALLCQLSTKSAIPYINFISEPIGAMVALLIVKIPFKLNIKDYSFKTSVVTFLGTVASGLTYVTAMKTVLFIKGAQGPLWTAMLTVVFATALANTVVAQLLYYPIKLAFGKKEVSYE